MFHVEQFLAEAVEAANVQTIVILRSDGSPWYEANRDELRTR
jgi:hypothetical protein